MTFRKERKKPAQQRLQKCLSLPAEQRMRGRAEASSPGCRRACETSNSMQESQGGVPVAEGFEMAVFEASVSSFAHWLGGIGSR